MRKSKGRDNNRSIIDNVVLVRGEERGGDPSREMIRGVTRVVGLAYLVR